MAWNVKAVAVTGAIIWGGSTLVVGLLNLASPGYGRAYLEMLASVYPGYHVEGTIGSVLTGTGYALLDGAVWGAVTAWIYNRAAR